MESDQFFKQSPADAIYEILRNQDEFGFVESPTEAGLYFTRKLIIPNFWEACAKTIVLFNTQDIKLPPLVDKEEKKFGFHNFNRFALDGAELILKFEDGTEIKKFIPRERIHLHSYSTLKAAQHTIMNKYFPKYKKKYPRRITIRNSPNWEPTTHLLSFSSLKIELADACIKKLDSKQRENVLMDLAPILDYAIFNLQGFREVVDEWKKRRRYEKIKLLSRILNKAYSRSRIKQSETNYSYVRIYLEVNKLVKQANTSVLKACRKIATSHNKKVRYIHRRYYQVKKEVEKRRLTDEELERQYEIFDI